MNKKRIAQRQAEMAAAAKKDKKKKTLGVALQVSLWVAAVAVVILAAVLIFGGNKPAGDIYADIQIQNYGTVTVKLDREAAPITVENFVKLAESGFYDGLTFHRIVEGFVMQGGDPEGNGTGGADKDIKGEFKENGWNNPLSHTAGAISMARSNDPNSASSQFFIVHKDSTSLDGKYAVFGYVTEGMEIVDKVCNDAKPTDNNGTIPKDKQPVITAITIREK